MTRSGSKYESPSDVKKEWIRTVVRKLAIVLIFAGWTGVGTNPPWEASTSFLTTRYWERIEEIVNLALDLDRGMGEGIVSEDIVIFSVGGGSSFDGGGEFRVLDSDHVLCTCELGPKVSRLIQKDGYSPILVKPKVVVCSTMSEIIPPKVKGYCSYHFIVTIDQYLTSYALNIIFHLSWVKWLTDAQKESEEQHAMDKRVLRVSHEEPSR